MKKLKFINRVFLIGYFFCLKSAIFLTPVYF